jgi:hypothetical protein
MKVGDKVICVDSSLPHPEIAKHFDKWVEQDKTYIIRGKRLWYGEYSLLLEEIKNPPMYNPEIMGNCEPGYSIKRFRLVDPVEELSHELEEIQKFELV